MKKIICFGLCVLFACLCAFGLAEETLWTEGTMEIDGHTIEIHAIVDDTMPSALQQIKLGGKAMKKTAFLQSLQQHFSVHPDFTKKNIETVDDFFISGWADEWCGFRESDSDYITHYEVENFFPIKEPELQNLYSQCTAFLADQGIEASPNLGYISYYNYRDRDYIIVLIPYRIEGLSTECRHLVVSRDILQFSNNTGKHIMDHPWADFIFDMQGRLSKIEMSTFQITKAQPLDGQAISWQEAVEIAMPAAVSQRVAIQQGGGGQPDYSEERFWQDYRIQLSRVTPLWLPNWFNVCLPGWYIKFQLYSTTTDELVYSRPICVHALTGELVSR